MAKVAAWKQWLVLATAAIATAAVLLVMSFRKHPITDKERRWNRNLYGDVSDAEANRRAEAEGLCPPPVRSGDRSGNLTERVDSLSSDVHCMGLAYRSDEFYFNQLDHARAWRKRALVPGLLAIPLVVMTAYTRKRRRRAYSPPVSS